MTSAICSNPFWFTHIDDSGFGILMAISSCSESFIELCSVPPKKCSPQLSAFRTSQECCLKSKCEICGVLGSTQCYTKLKL